MVSLRIDEQRVQQFINRIAGMITGETLERVAEPTVENTIYVDRRPARYRGRALLRLKTRFGNCLERSRRRYAIRGGGSHYPLDERFGVNMCGWFTPLLTYLLNLFGASEPYEAAGTAVTRRALQQTNFPRQ